MCTQHAYGILGSPHSTINRAHLGQTCIVIRYKVSHPMVNETWLADHSQNCTVYKDMLWSKTDIDGFIKHQLCWYIALDFTSYWWHLQLTLLLFMAKGTELFNFWPISCAMGATCLNSWAFVLFSFKNEASRAAVFFCVFLCVCV